MQYINLVSTDNNIYYYRPSENLRRLFEDLAVKPLSESRPDVAVNPSMMHALSRPVLGRGTTNFDASTGGYGDTLIIFNFCYFLQSRTVNIRNLAKVISDLISQHSRYKFSIVYQDPTGDRFQQKWYRFKNQMAKNTQVFESLTWQENLNLTPVKYDRLLIPGQDLPRVYYAMSQNW